MRLAHSIPLAGHLGKNKTTSRVLQRFYWPTVYRDVAKFCRSCASCQKETGRKAVRAPLVPLPITTQPFSRIAMDIVGPLPRSRRGNRYVLVVCDYANRYPEAVALRSIDAETIAEELVTIFSRVGIPQEILTDQGANFTSHLLTELYRMLHVRPIRTTPYHPQTDGLVERFNQTLKHMLRKSVGKEGTNGILCCRTFYLHIGRYPSPRQVSLPLYGNTVRGPFDILSECWQGNIKCEESVVSHVLAIRERLEGMMKLAQFNSEVAQKRQSQWYNQKSRQREFAPDEMVLLLLPTTHNKLLAKWQGPYRILKKVGKVNYLIDMHDHQKRRRVYHVNLLKKWETPLSECCAAEEITDEEDFPDWRAVKEVGQPKIGEQLSEKERQDLQSVLLEFADVLQGKPG